MSFLSRVILPGIPVVGEWTRHDKKVVYELLAFVIGTTGLAE